jgi:hypothetical protein
VTIWAQKRQGEALLHVVRPHHSLVDIAHFIAISGDYKFSRGEHCGLLSKWCKITFVTFTQVVFLLLFLASNAKIPAQKSAKKSLIKPASSFQFSDNLGPKAPRRSTSPCRAAALSPRRCGMCTRPLLPAAAVDTYYFVTKF